MASESAKDPLVPDMLGRAGVPATRCDLRADCCRSADTEGRDAAPAVDDCDASLRLCMPVDEPREKTGWAGGRRPAARDILEPECDRECVYAPAPEAAAPTRFDDDVERFTADAGTGIADMFTFMPPRV